MRALETCSPLPESARRLRYRAWLKLLFSLLLLGASPLAWPRERLQAELKAVWLYKFAHFVDWPAGVFESADSPLRICVLADDTFADLVAAAIEGERVGSRPLGLTRLGALSEIPEQGAGRQLPCHILFLGDSPREHDRPLLERLGAQPVLSVSEVHQPAYPGSIISLLPGAGGRIELRLDRARARCARLSVSAKLLRISTVVDSRLACPKSED